MSIVEIHQLNAKIIGVDKIKMQVKKQKNGEKYTIQTLSKRKLELLLISVKTDFRIRNITKIIL
jgi:hypothetical protein